MKLFFKGFLLVLLSSVLVLENHAISNLQISRICRKERKEKACLKRLKLNRELLITANQ